MVAWWNLFQAIIVVAAFGGIDGRVLEKNSKRAKRKSIQ